MAIYHLEAKVVSRGAGRSAVAASAYLSCSRLYNDYDGIQHDYTKKQGLVWQQVFLPSMAPPEWQDREKLWNAVEENEKTKDSRLAREFVIGHVETAVRMLQREQQIGAFAQFLAQQCVLRLEEQDVADVDQRVIGDADRLDVVAPFLDERPLFRKVVLPERRAAVAGRRVLLAVPCAGPALVCARSRVLRSVTLSELASADSLKVSKSPEQT